MLRICCVDQGNYLGRGIDYVNILYDSVARNINREFQFVCYSDREGYDPDIEVKLLPDIKGWWSKLYLFSQEKGETWYFDLDTGITGHLDFEYTGSLAILRDFYRPDGYGSGVMMWNSDHSHIWEDWVKAGKLEGGDQIWMERYPADLLQNLYPDQFVSYKAHCKDWPPNGAKVVCFHGNPRPHHLPSKWVEDIWKIGGLSGPKFINTLNNEISTILGQVEQNIKRDLPWFGGGETNQTAVLVGGGPSLKDSLTKLRSVRKADIFALNNAHDFLMERGITPKYHVLLDSRLDNIEFVKNPKKSTTYLVSAACHPDIFEALTGYNVVLWLTDMDGVEPMVRDIKDKPVCLVGGGATVGMKTMYLAYLMGYRHYHFFGFDSSYHENENHAYPQPLNDRESRQIVTAAGKEFVCAPWMMKQAQEFQQQARKLLDLGCKLTVHGYGLIPHIVQHWR